MAKKKKSNNIPFGVCTACGAELPDDTEFCIGYGKAVYPAAPEPARPSQEATFAPPQGGVGLVGFSDRCNSPEILAAAQKNKKYSIGCMDIGFRALVGFPIAGLLMDDFTFGGSLLSVLVLLLSCLSLICWRCEGPQPMWEGVVVNKYSKEKKRKA